MITCTDETRFYSAQIDGVHYPSIVLTSNRESCFFLLDQAYKYDSMEVLNLNVKFILNIDFHTNKLDKYL